MKNKLSIIFSKAIKMILTILLVISTLIMPSKVIAVPSDEQKDQSYQVEDSEENLKLSKIDLPRSGTPTKYLFVGNSKTYYNNFPFMFQNFMNSLGYPTLVREVTKGGWSLTKFYDDEDIYTEEFFKYYDYVVIQPKLLETDEEAEAAVAMVKGLLSRNENIKVIINGIWKSKDKYKTNTKAQNLMNKRFRALRDKIKNETKVNDVRISYWGQAVLRAVHSNSIPKTDLFTDERHPTTLSSYLGVASLYSTLTGNEANCNYNGAVDNSKFKSTGDYSNENWQYQRKKDRWKIDTKGISENDVKKMQGIAYKTYIAQLNGEADKLDVYFNVDNSPRISIKKKNKDKDQGINVVITDYSGLKDENIKIYKSDKKTEIKPKKPEAKTKEGNTYQLIYSFDKNYFNNKYKQIYVVAKDNNENYNKSTFNIKKKSKNKYSIDAAPRIKGFELDSDEKQTTIKGVDNAGLKYLKVYDLNQKVDGDKHLLVKQVKNVEGNKSGKSVKIDLDDLKEKDNEKQEAKDHYYSIKVVAKDVNGRKSKRIINYKITNK